MPTLISAITHDQVDRDSVAFRVPASERAALILLVMVRFMEGMPETLSASGRRQLLVWAY